MIDFVESLFPEDIAYGAVGGPEFYTRITVTSSGKEYRNINWIEARNRYNVSHGVKNQEQMQKLLAFFYAMHGKAIGFRFKDWLDYKVEAQTIGTGDNSNKTYQLFKIYNNNGNVYKRKISKPTNSVKIFLDKVQLDSTEFKIDIKTGLIAFNSPPNNNVAIIASFHFDVPVRFDNDRLIASIDESNRYTWKDINLVELKL
ncbi:Glycoside hydrolase family 24 [Candidatus Xenohaliotis californiensis]|uniref:Glycoside hydrolase family 24 n=1 Tax=Candidatus Xenohaliotis californiensis TaxID=84677 RepID=A0ABP0EWD0_9RICK|nr:Glycoside hydrolase family 24 [Candidatus Xenohaliotis californiensis]